MLVRTNKRAFDARVMYEQCPVCRGIEARVELVPVEGAEVNLLPRLVVFKTTRAAPEEDWGPASGRSGGKSTIMVLARNRPRYYARGTAYVLFPPDTEVNYGTSRYSICFTMGYKVERSPNWDVRIKEEDGEDTVQIFEELRHGGGGYNWFVVWYRGERPTWPKLGGPETVEKPHAKCVPVD